MTTETKPTRPTYTCKNGTVLDIDTRLDYSLYNRPPIYTFLKLIILNQQRHIESYKKDHISDTKTFIPILANDVYEEIEQLQHITHFNMIARFEMVLRSQYGIDLNGIFITIYLKEIAKFALEKTYEDTRQQMYRLRFEFRQHPPEGIGYINDMNAAFEKGMDYISPYDIDSIIHQYFYVDDWIDYYLFLHWSPAIIITKFRANRPLRPVELHHPKLAKYTDFLTEQCHKYPHHPSVPQLLAKIEENETITLNKDFMLWK